MQKSTAKAWLAAGLIGLSTTIFATHALADCDSDQDSVGKVIAAAATAKLGSVIPGQGKKMINLDNCYADGKTMLYDFKYNIIGADGLYWVQGHVKLSSGAVAELKFTSLSPNLAAASAKAGVKLASN
jgi:hypothetical protein